MPGVHFISEPISGGIPIPEIHDNVIPINGSDGSVISDSDARSIIEAAPYGICRFVQDGRILLANPAFARLLGYSAVSEVLYFNAGLDIFLDRTENERLKNALEREHSISRHQATWKRRDGSEFCVNIAGRLLYSEKPGPTIFEIFVEEIAKLNTNVQPATETSEPLKKTLRSALHDFNNHLMIMTTCADLLQDGSQDPTDLNYVSQIKTAATKSIEIVRRLSILIRR